MKGTITVDIERCKGCAVCVPACPFGVVGLSKGVNAKGYPHIVMMDPDACTGCANCAVVCPDGCITVFRQRTPRDPLEPRDPHDPQENNRWKR